MGNKPRPEYPMEVKDKYDGVRRKIEETKRTQRKATVIAPRQVHDLSTAQPR